MSNSPMAKINKLNDEIRQFIVQQKKLDSRLSCRGLVTLIREQFNTSLSKSSINFVFKQNLLSSPVGRRKSEKGQIPRLPDEKPFIRQESEFMVNGGFFFLKAADLSLGLTTRLAESFSGICANLSAQTIRVAMEALIYAPYFQDKRNLWLLMGKEIPPEKLNEYSQVFNRIPVSLLRESATKAGFGVNINDINMLYQRCLVNLNSYITDFFPQEYQFLSFSAMRERFYCLPAKLEKKAALLAIQLFFPAGFFWMNDIIWQEGFFHAANRVNEAQIFTPDREQIWINPQPQAL